jgi:hypothetical protein
MPKNGIHASRREYKEQREAAIQASLAKKNDPAEKFHEQFGPTPFRELHRKYRKILVRGEGWPTLWRLIGFRDRWVRPLDEWKPKGRALETVLRSLVDHLICQYKMPAYWYEVWFRGAQRGLHLQNANGEFEDTPAVQRACAQFVQLANGTGLYRLIQADEFPVKFTKKQAHAFMQQRGVNTVTQAARWTQVQSFGGDRRLAEVLCKTDWGEDFQEESFRAPVIQWFCNQAMIDPAQVGPLVDYIEHARHQQDNWSVKGRTARSLMRSMEEWHKVLAADQRFARRERAAAWRADLAERRKPPPEKFEKSGIAGWETVRKTKDNRTGKQIHVRYAITELMDYQALMDEGRELSHCASSYAWSIAKGQKSLWSFSIAKEKELTIEVRNPTKTIVQVRGLRNRMPTAAEMSYVQKWATENDLIITTRAVSRGW